MKLSPEIKEILKADMYGACSKDKYNMLKIKQNLSLDDKVVLTKIRIKEWYEKFNGNICVSFSGGKRFQFGDNDQYPEDYLVKCVAIKEMKEN